MYNMSESGQIETSLTTDYRKDRWGFERIVLDSISNHLPEDSNGSEVNVRLEQEGEWTDLLEADNEDEIERAVFEDDGDGFDSNLLGVLYSTKSADANSVGQFGEGLKMVAAAAEREGVDVEYRSRDWVARPFTEEELVDGERVERLHFDVEERPEIQGSKTIFHSVPEGLEEEIRNLPQKVLQLNPGFEVLDSKREGSSTSTRARKLEEQKSQIENRDKYDLEDNTVKNTYERIESRLDELTSDLEFDQGYNSRIIDLHPGQDKVSRAVVGETERNIFVKGIKVQEENAIFNYDLNLEEIKPDRSHTDREEMLDEIETLVKNPDSREVIETILEVANEAPGASLVEYEAFRDRSNDDVFGNMGKREMLDASGFGSELGYGSYEDSLESSGKSTNLWEEVFHDVFGEDAVIAASSFNQDANKDARALGYNPVEINSQVANYLSDQGVTRANEIDNERQYNWIPERELTQEEAQLLSRLDEQGREDLAALEVMEDELDEDIIERYSVPDVRVYDGVRLESGRELEDENPAVYIKEGNGENYIGLQRHVLDNEADARVKYKEEWGHHVTDRADYQRAFAEAFMKLDAAKDMMD